MTMLLVASLCVVATLCVLFLYHWGQVQHKRAEHWKSVAMVPMKMLNEGRLSGGTEAGNWGMAWEDNDDDN